MFCNFFCSLKCHAFAIFTFQRLISSENVWTGLSCWAKKRHIQTIRRVQAAEMTAAAHYNNRNIIEYHTTIKISFGVEPNNSSKRHKKEISLLQQKIFCLHKLLWTCCSIYKVVNERGKYYEIHSCPLLQYKHWLHRLTMTICIH